jgi:TolB-like protein/DNA-binding SARP family transcriptional activator
MIRFYTLGPLDLQASDGRQLKSVLAQPKRVALLAYLAACGKGDSHRRDTLLGLFWPDLDESRARHALNQSLYVLRRAIGPSVFVSTGDEELALAPEAIWCDAAAFAEDAEAGRSREALEAYRGDLLDGFFISDAPEFEKWLDVERQRLRRLAARAAWSLSEEEETAGNVEAAAERARQAAGYSLENEAAVRRLVGLLDRVGDRAAAVRAYEAFAQRLRDELGVDPSPETQELVASIRARGVPAEAAAADLGPSSGALAERPAASLERPTAASARPATGSSGVGEIWEALDPEATAAPTRPTPPTPAERSVAVLPFVDLSAESDREYFADGISEELISSLAQVDGLRIAARTSSFKFKDATEDVREIGDLLNVSTVLEGSVRMSDDRVRITVQLVDVRDGFQIWGERYDRQMADIFAVQEEIAREIVEHLRAELVGEPDQTAPPLVRSHTDVMEAYQLYLKGQFLCKSRRVDGLRASIECFEEAISLDPDYALAYAGLADAYSLLGWYRYLTADEAYERIQEATGKALELEARVPEACTSRAYAKFIYEWDFPGAETEFQHAIELNPRYPTVHHWYGEYLMAMGRLQQANETLQRAHDLDPLSLTVAVGLGWSNYFLGEYEEAVERYEGVVAMDPDFVIVPWFLGPAYVQAGRHDDAVELYEEWIGRIGEHPGLVALLAQAHALAGRKEEAREVYGRLEQRAKRAPIFPDYRALVHAALGEADEAFEWLEKALEERCWVLVFLRVDPAYQNLRSDPRFDALTERIGLSPSGPPAA